LIWPCSTPFAGSSKSERNRPTVIVCCSKTAVEKITAKVRERDPRPERYEICCVSRRNDLNAKNVEDASDIVPCKPKTMTTGLEIARGALFRRCNIFYRFSTFFSSAENTPPRPPVAK
jgi:hypothetical protein